MGQGGRGWSGEHGGCIFQIMIDRLLILIPRLVHAVLPVLGCLAFMAVGGCNSTRPIVADGSHTNLRDTSAGSVDSIPPAQTITPNPLDAERERQNDPVLIAERLGQLDAMIRTAPADSIAYLRAEYEALLEEYTGESRIVATGNSDLYNPAREALDHSGSASDVDSFLASRDNGRPRRPVASPTVAGSREELRASGDRRDSSISALAVNTARRSNAVRSRTSTPGTISAGRQSTRVRSADARRRTRAVVEEQTMPTASAERADGKREYIDGLAAARAGRYDEAAVQLPKAIESGDLSPIHRARARQTYGQSLEASGDPAGASAQYQSASRQRGDIGERAYIDRCRAMALSGEREKARAMLREFIRSHPRSKQVVNARRLLQTI